MLSTPARVLYCLVAIATKPATRQFPTISVVYVIIVLVYCIVRVVGEPTDMLQFCADLVMATALEMK